MSRTSVTCHPVALPAVGSSAIDGVADIWKPQTKWWTPGIRVDVWNQSGTRKPGIRMDTWNWS